MKNLMTKNVLPILGIALWLAICYPVCNKSEGFNYFLFWIMAGFPFGIRFMCLKLIPKSYGISGTVGVFALNALSGGLIGGAMLMMSMVRIFVNTIKLVMGTIE